MPPTRSLRQEVKQLMASNRLKEAFRLLKQQLDLEEAPALERRFIGLTRRYNDALDEKMANTTSRQELQIDLNQISDDLFDFLSQLTDEHLRSPHALVDAYRAVGHPLLIVGESLAQAQETEALLSDLNFTHLSSQTAAEVAAREAFDEFHLVVFNNFDLPDPKALAEGGEALRAQVQAREAAMQSVIDRSNRFLIHYGNYLPWINQHRDRVNSANSQFTLYARIHEVLSFIRTYRV